MAKQGVVDKGASAKSEFRYILCDSVEFNDKFCN